MSITISPIPGACPYEPPESLWSLVEKSTPPHEREEIKRMLGESLIEQSLELHEEVNLLLEIWRDYRDETEDLMSKSVQRLPEPPAARDRLKQEIKFFVESIREKSKDNGRDVTRALSGNNSAVIQYALDERCSSSGYGSRPSTARSSQGRETPMIGNERARSSMLCTLSDEVDAINDKLTYLKFDEVVAHLRETLESEVLTLREDADFLQKCLDDEVDFRSQSREGAREPSLADLSVERGKLEKELLKPESRVPLAVRNAKASTALKTIPNSISSKGLSQVRPTPPSVPKTNPAGAPPRRAPLKASHDINVSRQSPEIPDQSRTRTGSGRKENRVILPQTSAPGTNKVSLTRVSSSGDPHRMQARSRNTGNPVNDLKSAQADDDTNTHEHFRMPDTSTHITIRSRPVRKRVTEQEAAEQVDSGYLSEPTNEEEAKGSPSSKPSRPGSASRFRRMVQQCRDDA